MSASSKVLSISVLSTSGWSSYRSVWVSSYTHHTDYPSAVQWPTWDVPYDRRNHAVLADELHRYCSWPKCTSTTWSHQLTDRSCPLNLPPCCSGWLWCSSTCCSTGRGLEWPWRTGPDRALRLFGSGLRGLSLLRWAVISTASNLSSSGRR
jgi:hypothetical protein